jgi:uncharacterized membrane protein
MTIRVSPAKPKWLVPAGLILLSFIPVVAGSIRVAELAGGAEITPGNARFFAMPVPVLLHIVSASLYCVVGAFQFVPSLRRRWHRPAGRVMVLCGLVAAFSGLWMTLFLVQPVGDLLSGLRLLFGSAMALSIILGFLAIRRRDVLAHRAWMIRGYAIGQGAGTQAVTQAPWIMIVGPPNAFITALLMGAGWVINLVVAERIISRIKETR